MQQGSDFEPAPPLARAHDTASCALALSQVEQAGLHIGRVYVLTVPPLTHAAGHRVPAGNHACPVLALSCRSVRLGRAGQCLVGQSLGRGAHVPPPLQPRYSCARPMPRRGAFSAPSILPPGRQLRGGCWFGVSLFHPPASQCQQQVRGRCGLVHPYRVLHSSAPFLPGGADWCLHQFAPFRTSLAAVTIPMHSSTCPAVTSFLSSR